MLQKWHGSIDRWVGQYVLGLAVLANKINTFRIVKTSDLEMLGKTRPSFIRKHFHERF